MNAGEGETQVLFFFYKTTERDRLFYGKLDVLLQDALNFSMIKYT